MAEVIDTEVMVMGANHGLMGDRVSFHQSIICFLMVLRTSSMKDHPNKIQMKFKRKQEKKAAS